MQGARVGILIAGSLYWDDDPCRRCWRKRRLRTRARARVHAPVRYWRKSESRGDSYTMVFTDEANPEGQALAVPCVSRVRTLADLVREATALWAAEAPKWRGPPLGASAGDPWGTVGLLVNPESEGLPLQLREEWCAWAADDSNLHPVGDRIPVANGLLEIEWPSRADGRPLELDLLLATANQRDEETPDAEALASRWIENSTRTDTTRARIVRSERYFFRNVGAGVRTQDDEDIWHRMRAVGPAFLGRPEHEAAIAILNAEFGTA